MGWRIAQATLIETGEYHSQNMQDLGCTDGAEGSSRNSGPCGSNIPFSVYHHLVSFGPYPSSIYEACLSAKLWSSVPCAVLSFTFPALFKLLVLAAKILRFFKDIYSQILPPQQTR